MKAWAWVGLAVLCAPALAGTKKRVRKTGPEIDESAHMQRFKEGQCVLWLS